MNKNQSYILSSLKNDILSSILEAQKIPDISKVDSEILRDILSETAVTERSLYSVRHKSLLKRKYIVSAILYKYQSTGIPTLSISNMME